MLHKAPGITIGIITDHGNRKMSQICGYDHCTKCCMVMYHGHIVTKCIAHKCM